MTKLCRTDLLCAAGFLSNYGSPTPIYENMSFLQLPVPAALQRLERAESNDIIKQLTENNNTNCNDLLEAVLDELYDNKIELCKYKWFPDYIDPGYYTTTPDIHTPTPSISTPTPSISIPTIPTISTISTFSTSSTYSSFRAREAIGNRTLDKYESEMKRILRNCTKDNENIQQKAFRAYKYICPKPTVKLIPRPTRFIRINSTSASPSASARFVPPLVLVFVLVFLTVLLQWLTIGQIAL